MSMGDCPRPDNAAITMSEGTVRASLESFSFVDSNAILSSNQQRDSSSSPDGSSASWEKNAGSPSDGGSVDLDALYNRLNEYNSRNEAAWAILRQQRKEAHDVAAAARFRRRLESAGIDEELDPSPLTTSIMGTGGAIKSKRAFSAENFTMLSKNRLTRAKDSQSAVRQKKITRPPPLRLDVKRVRPQEIQSAALPIRTSSRRATEDYIATEDAPTLPLLRRRTISGSRHQSRSQAALPPRSASRSDPSKPVTTLLSPSRSNTPANPSITASSAPNEDQIRREVELALSQGRDMFRGEQRRSRKMAQMLSAEMRNELSRVTTAEKQASMSPASVEEVTSEPALADPPLTPTQSSLRRKRSLFGWMQKKSEVDELIELYMNDEQLEEPRRTPSKSRLGRLRLNRLVTDPLPMKMEPPE